MKYVLMFTSRPDLDAAVDPEHSQAVYKRVYEWFVENGEAGQDRRRRRGAAPGHHGDHA